MEEKVESREEKLLPQSAVDAIVQDRVAREKAKIAPILTEYEDLKKFKTEHEKNIEVATQKELEARKEYDKLKETWNSKQQELTTLINNKDNEIKDMRLSTALMSEISKQNAYAEETMALLKPMAVFDSEGNIRIKGRDANGLEVQHSVEEGTKSFLTQRPHLVKATKPGGSGSLPSNLGGTNAGVQDLNTLNAELQTAMNRGDRKTVEQTKLKINAILGKR